MGVEGKVSYPHLDRWLEEFLGFIWWVCDQDQGEVDEEEESLTQKKKQILEREYQETNEGERDYKKHPNKQ